MYDQRRNPFRQPNPVANGPDPVSDQALLTLTALDRAMGQLTEELRAVILLIGLERLTYDQTAAVLRVPVGTMRARLSNGRGTLRRALGSAEEISMARAA
jgi:RNA polymerase sigma-70 factor (ECF subfamily)